jgi:peptidase G2-like protein/endosialidase-like protein
VDSKKMSPATLEGVNATVNATNLNILTGGAASNAAALHTHNTFVNKAGDTMSGALNLPANGLVVGGNQFIASGGNVGVGTASPENSEGWSKVLDMLGGTTTKLSVRTTNIDARVLAHESGWWGAPAGMIIGTRTNHPLSLGTNAASRMTIDSVGRVGIGKTNPAGTLDVNGDIYRAGLLAISGEAGGWLRINQNNDFPNGTHFAHRANFYAGITTGNWWSVEPGVGNLLVQGNVGIGKSNPSHALDVSGNARVSGSVLFGSGGNINGDQGGSIELGNSLQSGVVPYIDFHYGLGVQQDYNMRIINDAPAWLSIYGGFLRVNGTAYLSDLRMKKNVHPLSASLNKLRSLRGVSYQWKDMRNETEKHIGLIAQDVEMVFPDAVKTGPDGMKSIDYTGLIAPVIEAIKEQQRIIDELSLVRAGSDFAEYFQSIGGKAIKPGTSVVLEGSEIRPAKKGDVPIGVISVNPGLLGGAYFEWPGKYIKDDFGSLIMEEHKEEIMAPKKEKVKRERQKMEKKVVEEEIAKTEIVFRNGKNLQVEKKGEMKSEVATPVFKEVDLYDANGKEIIGKHRIPVMETYEEERDVFDEKGMPVMVGTGKFKKMTRPTLNPKYDEAKVYIPRDKRPEWNCVGLIGQLPLRKGQPAAPTWVKIKDISDKVELWLVK